MAKTILLKRTNVKGRVPTLAEIAVGELVYNSADGVIFAKKVRDGVESLVRYEEAEGLSSTPADDILHWDAVAGKYVPYFGKQGLLGLEKAYLYIPDPELANQNPNEYDIQSLMLAGILCAKSFVAQSFINNGLEIVNNGSLTELALIISERINFPIGHTNEGIQLLAQYGFSKDLGLLIGKEVQDYRNGFSENRFQLECLQEPVGNDITQYIPVIRSRVRHNSGSPTTRPLHVIANPLKITEDGTPGLLDIDIATTKLSKGTASRFLKLNADKEVEYYDLIEDIPIKESLTPGTPQTFEVDMKASFPYDIISMVLKVDSGTLLNVGLGVQRPGGGQYVSGISALTVTTDITEYARTNPLNSIVLVGERVIINTYTGYTGTPTKLIAKIKIRRL